MLQSTALDILKSGHNVFLTGSAGAGKSYTLKQYLQYLEDNKVKKSAIAITASTGIAATQIGGNTIHSWACIGIKTEMDDKAIVELIRYRKKQIEIIQEAKVLLIDEISMLHRKQLDLVNKVMQFARNSTAPFGGVQIIVTGDFYQLPPVVKKSTLELDRDRFCFMSDAWVDAKFKVCYLTEQHRNGTGQLNTVLNAIRNNNVEQEHFEILLSRQIKAKDDTNMLHLYTHNADVDMINLRKLKELQGEAKRFTAEKSGNEKVLKVLADSILAPQNLELKIGAKVMFVKNNIDGGYANGTQGEVVKFVADDQYDPPFLPVIKTSDGDTVVAEPVEWTIEENSKVIASIKQIPLRLAWAMTIHKSQGMTLDSAVINLGQTFEASQGYVALSRLRDISGLYLLNIRDEALQLNPLALKADLRFQELSNEIENELKNKEEFQKDIEIAKKTFLKHLKNKW